MTTAAYCSTLQHTATRCKIHCNTTSATSQQLENILTLCVLNGSFCANMGSLAVCMFNSRMSLCVCVCVCVGVCVSERERERESVCVHVLFVILCVRNLHVPMMFPQYFQLQNWAVQKRPSMCFLTTRILTIRVLNTPVRTKRIFTIRKLSTNTSTPRILTAASSSF